MDHYNGFRNKLSEAQVNGEDMQVFPDTTGMYVRGLNFSPLNISFEGMVNGEDSTGYFAGSMGFKPLTNITVEGIIISY